MSFAKEEVLASENNFANTDASAAEMPASTAGRTNVVFKAAEVLDAILSELPDFPMFTLISDLSPC